MSSLEAERFDALLARRLSGIWELTAGQVAQLYSHYTLLTRWNERLNLTSIRGPEEVVARHYCESVFLASRLPAGPASVLDIGSGAGFPGVPMAVVRPDCWFTMAESRQRKAVFLKEATRNWPHVRVFSGRAEEIAERFDWVVSRAVGWEEVVPVAVRLGSRIGLLVGEGDAKAAIKAGRVRWEEPVRLPWGKRRVLLCSTWNP